MSAVPVRLKDVAAHAGVSVKTVSNVVNGYTHVSAAMAARVQASIDALGYRPNLAARQLKHGRGGFLALALPQLDSPYFADLAARLHDGATKRGYLFLLDITGAGYEHERVALSGMRAHVVDGVIFSPLTITAEDITARSDDLPLVLLGERRAPAQVDHVAVDSVAASRAVGEHLIAGGRRRLAVIGHQEQEGTATVRLRGFREAVQAAGLDLPPDRVASVAAYDRADGYAAMQRLLALPGDERPDGVFAFNDLLAIGALRACHEAGVRVPDDVAVVGFDNLPEGAYGACSLSSVAPDMDELADAVLDLLVARIEGSNAPPQDVSVGWRLEIRESSAPSPSASSRPGRSGLRDVGPAGVAGHDVNRWVGLLPRDELGR